MTTETFPFTGNENESQHFSPTINGEAVNCQIRWNMSAQRWYLVVTDGSGTLLRTVALSESVRGREINLVKDIFPGASLSWLADTGVIEVTG
ncbi:hypothetical protein BL250_02310 [Erwinia sp. OLTSP20]|uniref:hypothetical protein n=1 Tax=unclassified Erwinia TaxID=2622719 RepID=UPI000C17ADA2|nr:MULTISPECIES: hypothetical protein [unclassified Erwinia]PIJ48823.1 hypothetical protein BV501_16235 [Erwinia sp. OAMSP11]PIJ69445.1 hypothetical protein BK416_15175 [Erwinia sp. OLSSP12]PIJ79279.1 hypothetical protein BLD47_15480 [Erwinia sp. OLCASP19]PIJ80805.1 hypothetical protein BLD46_14640 [Erwinia sp. OLMTSP26]PIJ82957.1 hypothetical protein BLD49_14535 [Erwinia sp. OLMDSP33]